MYKCKYCEHKINVNCHVMDLVRHLIEHNILKTPRESLDHYYYEQW